jgi:hypothetical protein
MLDYDYLNQLLPSEVNLKSLSFEDFKYLMQCHGSLDDTAIALLWDFYSGDDDDPSLLDIVQSWHQWDWDRFVIYYLTADSLDFECFCLGDTVLFQS